MFKFVVLSAVACLATSAPTPGLLHGGYAIPAATSYTSRVDVHSAPVIKTYAAPALVAAPVVSKTLVAAPAISYHDAPVLSSYSLGGLGYGGYGLGHDYGLEHGYSLGHGYSGLGYGYGHGW